MSKQPSAISAMVVSVIVTMVLMFTMFPMKPRAEAEPVNEHEVHARDVECFSGGRSIYSGQTDPAYPVYLGSQDDHVTFVDRATHRQTRVGGNCIVRWDDLPPHATRD